MAKPLESKAAANRRRVAKHRNNQREAKLHAINALPDCPPGLPEECVEDWRKTGQKLLENGLLTPARIDYLEQYCLMKAAVRRDGIDASPALHCQLKSVTERMWKPAPDDKRSAAPTNPFADL